jgi:hypothetical protein
MRRMPLRTQRRNTAYLNRPDSRFGQLDREPDGQALSTWTGLAIDLGGLVDQRFRPGAFGGAYLDELPTVNAPLDRRDRTPQFLFLRFVRSNG